MVELFSAGRQLWKVRIWMLISLVGAAVALWVGWDLGQSCGVRPADGGRLASLPVRLAWGLGVASLGLVFAAGMWLYGRLYVATIVYDEPNDIIHVRTLGFVGHHDRTFSSADVKGSRYHRGRFYTGKHLVDAPWTNVHMKGMRWPFIVDAQGEFPNREIGARIFGGR